MKITCIAPSTIPSETANSVQVMKVCQALTQLGHETSLIVPGDCPVAWDQLKDHYGLVTVFPIRWLPVRPSLRKIDFAWNSLKEAEKDNAQLIYTRLLWVAVLALKRKMPVILELHEVPAGRFSPWLYRRYVRMSGIKLTVFITRALKEHVETRLKLQHKPFESFIAPDGVDLERFERLPTSIDARKLLGLTESFTAVYSGGFYPGRGLENLFALAKAFPQAQFIWIGGKPEQIKHWQEQLAGEEIQNVRLPGYVSNRQLPLYQAAAEVLLIPYDKKVAGNSGGNIASVTSPMKVFEYLASGKAILSSDLPVLHEVLNESNACFYPSDNIEAMIREFARLMNETSYRQSLAMQAKKDAQRYSWKTRMNSILEWFNLLQAEHKA